jgi:Protein of unknown function (DUF2782)
MRARFVLLLLLASGLVSAQNPARPADLQPIPDGPPGLAPEPNAPVPEVTIRRRGDQGTVEEFRAGGVLYMIRINPARGPSYYLVDTDGDGNLETRTNDLQSGMLIPAWVLLRW